MLFTSTQALALITQYGYLLLFPIAVIEGPVIAVIGGFLASIGTLNLWIVFLVLLFGDVVGDLFYYALGRWGHGRMMQRFVAFIGVTPERMEKMRESFHKYHWKILLLNKTQALGAIVLYFSGVIRMPVLRYILVNTIGSFFKIALLETTGFYFGKGYSQIQGYITDVYLTFSIPIVLLGFYWGIKRYSSTKENLGE